jgi:uncharacterized protein YbbC (DUF1343 family)
MQSKFQNAVSKTFRVSKTFKIWFAIILFFNHSGSFSQPKISDSSNVIVGAERMNDYLPLLRGKNIALIINQPSVVGKTFLIDTLLHSGITVKKIFAPEHGFRGNADAGEVIGNDTDAKTGIPIVSLYAKEHKPSSTQLKGIDLMVYDIQDVGVRFYTYISTLHFVMEACAENNIELLILDRPNPNGFYVDGPILDSAFHSFVGVDPIPIVYGMTPAEYGLMLNGEHWLSNGVQCKLQYVLCENYDHSTTYRLPVNPSPNLRSMTAIYLYPSLCLFEGTQVSVGRGTDKPFVLIGYPDFKNGKIHFTPESVSGAMNPPYLRKECSGYDLSGLNTGFFVWNNHIMLRLVEEFYDSYPEKEKFFSDYFDKLAGTDQLRKQIEKGTPEMEIRRSWEPKLSEFKLIREKYLLYKDFE